MELTILFTDDKTIRKYHKKYFGSAKPTNVIAFSQREGENPPQNRSLGDILISVETAQKEACVAGVDLEERLVYLMIHGILHLQGYDHGRSDADTRRMRRMEKRLFRKVGGSERALRAF